MYLHVFIFHSSAKFARKLRFVNSLKELSSLIPMDQVCIPDRVKQ